MPHEREATIWCPRCGVDKFELWRVPVDNDGHHAHVTVPPSIPEDARKFCACGAQLERKATVA